MQINEPKATLLSGARERNYIGGGDKILINGEAGMQSREKISDTLTCDCKPLLILGSLSYPSNSSQFKWLYDTSVHTV